MDGIWWKIFDTMSLEHLLHKKNLWSWQGLTYTLGPGLQILQKSTDFLALLVLKSSSNHSKLWSIIPRVGGHWRERMSERYLSLTLFSPPPMNFNFPFSGITTYIHASANQNALLHRTQVVGSYECLNKCTLLVYLVYGAPST